MAVMGLDIGNAFGYMETVNRQGASEEVVSLMPDSMKRTGLPTEVDVKPGSLPKVGDALSSGGKKYRTSERCKVRSVKNKLLPQKDGRIQETIRCELPDGTVFYPELRKLFKAIVKEMVTVANQSPNLQEPIYEVVAAVPSIFAEDENQKGLEQIRNTISSISITDSEGNSHLLKLIDTIPEPAAASIAYLHARMTGKYGEMPDVKSLCVAVYDFGHGTFDTALTSLNTENYSYKVWHRDGLPVGGGDMDTALFEYFKGQIEDAGININDCSSQDMEKLMDLARQAKEQLSDDDEFEDIIVLGTKMVTLSIDKAYFNEIIGEETIRTLRGVLDFARKENHSLDAIVMTGGCSNIPMVYEKTAELASEYGVVCHRFRPSLAIAEGTALYAASRDRLTEYAGYTYSMRHPANGKLTELIRPDAVLPAESKMITVRNETGRFRIVRNLDVNEGGLEYGRELKHVRLDVPVNTMVHMIVSVDREHRISLRCTKEDGTEVNVL